MEHYTAGVPKKEKSYVSFFDRITGSRLGGSRIGTILRGTTNVSYEEKSGEHQVYTPSTSTIFPTGLKGGSCFAAGIGILCLFSAMLMGANDNDAYDRIGRVAGSGLFLLFLGPLVMMHFFIYRTSSSVFHKILEVFGLGILYFFVVIGLLFLIYGLQLFCQEFFIFYDPDIGICNCDDRPLLTVDQELSFSDSVLEAPIKVVSIGDIESGPMGNEVLSFIFEQNPDLVVINGDLTYIADPPALALMLDRLSPDDRLPIFVTVGNHDTGIYTEYQAVVKAKYEKYIEATASEEDPTKVFRCQGSIGVDTVCSFHNMGFVFSGLGSTCGDDDELNINLRDHLESFQENNVTWRTVFIHKNQRLLQIGGKKDEVGIEAYENSLAFGAVVMNSHEHSYARTHTLTGVGDEPEDFISNASSQPTIGEGKMVVVANGLGGKSIRDAEADLLENSWWAKTFHSGSEEINYGVHSCTYRIDENPNLAECEFQTIDRFLVDRYRIISEHGTNML